MEHSSNSGLNLGLISIPQSLLMQTGTASILLLLLAQKASQSALVAMGQASEEIFRGDRLPILSFPNEDELSRS
ncbi:hypothetical protein OGM63_15300 [Plectonema radiosum NIES-515]|uniref:Uncharacterized protein n=1 Tax=Plectonema radiosum NIES-515 TaxID=2986073 RepID=A0ABT3B0G2_9CYAN|nr:hypothetical protein [Plectonema radiosum]MCV3214867.1 hypothetical protein [Plectonema radiosum NIES-515]